MSATDTPTTKLTTAELLAEPTQRDWLNICRALEATKDDVLSQTELLFPALCYINRRLGNGNGPAAWDSILSLRDAELLAELNMSLDEGEDDPDEGKDVSAPSGDTTDPSSDPSPAQPNDDPSPTAQPEQTSTPNTDAIERGFPSDSAGPSPSTTT